MLEKTFKTMAVILKPSCKNISPSIVDVISVLGWTLHVLFICLGNIIAWFFLLDLSTQRFPSVDIKYQVHFNSFQ